MSYRNVLSKFHFVETSGIQSETIQSEH